MYGNIIGLQPYLSLIAKDNHLRLGERERRSGRLFTHWDNRG